MKLPLIKGTRVDSEAEWRDSLPLNMTGFYKDVGQWTGYLRTIDGLKQFATGSGRDRGAIWSDRFKKHLRVSGNTLIEVDQFGSTIDQAGGVVIPGSNPVRMVNSFNSIAFVADGTYYRWTTSSFGSVTGPVGADPFIDMTWIDGYYIFTDGENLWNTTLADETAFNPNERAGSDFAPDEILGVDKTSDNKLIVFNRYTTERFYNNAGSQFPFARIPNAAIPIGIVGTNARARIGDGRWVVFGGSKEYSPSFYILTNSYQKISNKEIDSIIDGYSDYELATIEIEYRDTRDQDLVICHLPRDTLVYDISLSGRLGQPIWYRWKTKDNPYRAIHGVYDPRNIDNEASGWIYGDKQDSRIGKLDESTFDQYGEGDEFRCETPIIYAGGTVRVAEFVAAPGHSMVEDDVIFISTTKDGALYGPEVPLNRGNQGEYQKRLISRRLGDYPNWFGIRVRGNSKGIFSITGVKINET